MSDWIPTAIEALDEHLGGGIPEGNLVMITGPTGTLRSTLAYQIAARNAEDNSRGAIYLCLDDDVRRFGRQLEAAGFDLDLGGDLVEVLGIRGLVDRLDSTSDWLGDLLEFLRDYVTDESVDLVVIDSLSTLLILQGDLTENELHQFFRELRRLGCTVVFTVLQGLHPFHDMMEMYSDGVLISSGGRELTLKKMRRTPAHQERFQLGLQPGKVVAHDDHIRS